MARTKQCTMARHLPLSDQGVWAEIERCVNAAHYRRQNKGKPFDEWEFPYLKAARETLADGCNCSLPSIDRRLALFVKLGMLIPQGKQYRLPNGKWSSHTYQVMLHDFYATDNPCPPWHDEKEKGPSRPFPARGESKYTEDLTQEIRYLCHKDYSLREIARILGIPKTTVARLSADQRRWLAELKANRDPAFVPDF